MQALNGLENSGSFDFKAQFPFYREILYKPDFKHKYFGKSVIVDMDMSPGDFMSLIYLLKAPIEVIDVKVWLSGLAQYPFHLNIGPVFISANVILI